MLFCSKCGAQYVGVNQAFCSECGVPSDPGTANVQSEAPQKQKDFNLCPVCGQSDQTIRISGLIDGSQSTTQGYGVTTGIGVGTGGVGVGIADTSYTESSSTVLADRLAAPKYSNIGGCLLGVVLFVIVLGLGALGAVLPSSVISVIVQIVFVSVVLYALYWYFVPYGRFLKVQNRIIKEANLKIRAGYYCKRDDVAFFESTDIPLTPEEFTLKVRDTQQQEYENARLKVPFLNKLRS